MAEKKDKPKPKPQQQPAGDGQQQPAPAKDSPRRESTPPFLEMDLLKATKYFEVVLNDGERLAPARMLGYGQWHLHLDTELGRLLIPKHSIKYIILEKYEDDQT